MFKKPGHSGQLKWRSCTVITDRYRQATAPQHTIRGLALPAPVGFVRTCRARSKWLVPIVCLSGSQFGEAEQWF